jgi:5'(3')-deoxyribonucleotidase
MQHGEINMNFNMVIAIDVDDTLGDFSSAFIKYIKKIKKRDVDIHDLKLEEWWQAWGNTPENTNKIIYEFLESDDVMRMRPRIGAIRALKILKQAGHKLYVITGRPAKVHDRTKEWVKNNLPDVFEEVFCTDFHIVNHGTETKGKIAQKIGASVLIDDYPGYAKECAELGINVLLMDSFWNHSYNEEKGIERVKNWDEVLNKLNL